MLLFGHLGVTLGAAMAVQCAKQCFSTSSGKKTTPQSLADVNNESSSCRKRSCLATVTEALGKNIDIRFLLIGAILPDIIDKPLGIFHIGSGRSISHTLLFLLIFTFVGLILYFTRKWKRMLVLATGIFFHLILDSMWLNPHTLFWPFNGWQLPGGNPSDWFNIWGSELTRNPAVFIPELIGFIVVVYFSYFLFNQRKVIIFLKYGYFKNSVKTDHTHSIS